MIRRLGLAFAVLVSLSGCGMGLSGDEQYPLPSGVRSLDRNSSIQLTPHLHIDADESGPVVHVNYAGAEDASGTHPDELPLTNRVELWDSGKAFTVECLGLRRDVENSDEPVYAVRVVSKDAPAPEVSATTKPIAGVFAWEGGHSTAPTSGDSRVAYTLVSHAPLLAIGVDASTHATLITNFGIRTVDIASLYETPEMHDTKELPPAENKMTIEIGPARITLTRARSSGKTTASISVVDPQNYHGTIISNFDVPEENTSSLGMATYINPNGPQPPELSAFQRPDPAFGRSWELQLDPPINVEHGLGRGGRSSDGPAEIHAILWKLGDRIYGYAGYNFSDTLTPAGGRVEGIFGDDGKLVLRIIGEPNMRLESTWVGADEISGNASVWGHPPGASTKPERYHKFKLVKKRDDAGREEDKLCAQIDMLTPSLEYWDAITCAPSESYRTSMVAETVRLMRDDQSAGPESRDSLSAASTLAHSQYTAWLSSRNFWGENHPITQANKRIATALYKRVLQTNPLDYEYAMEDYVKMLTQAHDDKAAKNVRTAINRAKAANLD
ncbi:MAG: hypothetical protein U0105_16545 [Candidatus Obscuribacterales bacterium]